MTSKSRTIALAMSTSEDNSVSSKFFHKPTRIKAGGRVIETKWFGHAAPALVDLDKDGDLDLLIGQYTDGDVDINKNIGTDEAPEYSVNGKLKAGGEVVCRMRRLDGRRRLHASKDGNMSR